MTLTQRFGALLLLVLGLGVGCGTRGERAEHGNAKDVWAVTAWGDRYEIFAEAGPLIVGRESKSHTHVTILDGFASLRAGVVSAVLRGEQGKEWVYRQDRALRPGIFSILVKPEEEGTYDLSFRIESQAGREDVPAGRVRVGTEESPGGVVDALPSNPNDASPPSAGDPVGFLKEQQWRIPFATEWARRGTLQHSIRGHARIRPTAGGEAILAAPLDGVVTASSRLYVGRDVGRKTVVAQLTPRPTSGRSFAEIESQARLARERVERLEALLQREAVSRAEVERARAEAATLRAELDAVSGNGPSVDVTAPFSGRIAEVMVVPGQAVQAGAALARLTQSQPVWVEVALRPEHAALVGSDFAGLILEGPAGEPPLALSGRGIRLVSRSPEVDQSTGAVLTTFEASGTIPFRIGTAVEAEVLLPARREGIIVPAEAVVDDAGVPVVFVQTEGETFHRREVRLLARQGDRALVEGVVERERVVTRGAAAIRRASQLSSGTAEGHVH
jgi:RND family efflux transporter MFP subunit